MRRLNSKRYLVLYVKEKAVRGFLMKSDAFGPVMAITTVDANFPARDCSVVSDLGVPARANPELKVVSMAARVSTE